MPQDSQHAEMPISLQGQLLLADPSLKNGIFRKSVIFIAAHTLQEGAIGAIINHPSGKTVGHLVPELKGTPLNQLPVHRGGPLATDQLTFSSITSSQEKGIIYLPQISAQTAVDSITTPGTSIQASIGHSAWSPGQLENELKHNTWIPLKPSPSLLSHPPELDLWKTLLESISPYHSLLAEAPDNPELN